MWIFALKPPPTGFYNPRLWHHLTMTFLPSKSSPSSSSSLLAYKSFWTSLGLENTSKSQSSVSSEHTQTQKKGEGSSQTAHGERRQCSEDNIQDVHLHHPGKNHVETWSHSPWCPPQSSVVQTGPLPRCHGTTSHHLKKNNNNNKQTISASCHMNVIQSSHKMQLSRPKTTSAFRLVEHCTDNICSLIFWTTDPVQNPDTN